MREIKFRALYAGVWYYFSLDDIMSLIYVDSLKSDEYGFYKGKHKTQFTGLKDKNGVEIYEGDIVKCGYGYGEVIFHVGCFMVQWIEDKGADMEFLFSRNGRRARDNYDEFEIIGNIYQHPELITNK